MPAWVRVSLERSPLGLLGVAASIDGHAVKLLVDTGANTTVLDRGRAGEKGLIGERTEEEAVGCSDFGEVDVLAAESLELGEVRIECPNVNLVDLSHVNAQFESAGATPVDGVLGADILTGREAEIAYAKPELRLRPDARA